MAEFHRKIELQSPEDLQYLMSNVRRAAYEKIDKDLPPMPGEDPMRKRVEELVHGYIVQVFLNASESLTVNGLPVSELLITNSSDSETAKEVEEYEPLDGKLYERALALQKQEEELVEEIAALRRKNPGVAVELAKEGYRQGVERDEMELAKMEEELRNIVREERKSGLGVQSLQRQGDVEASWLKGVKGLEALKSGLPETVAKKERAERAEQYVLAPEKKG
ncbi:hypothetical protein BP5796_07252 [Coleophoma crateriformis]|uniref:Kinetochore protein mis14 n=1 Tax=Coleophoma crateriformis TaxID=565419 RepID=A0A3D8RIK9_9HELO|nr:hypothetical protein BP5796_07252 [Coleophoma crateriformis]